MYHLQTLKERRLRRSCSPTEKDASSVCCQSPQFVLSAPKAFLPIVSKIGHKLKQDASPSVSSTPDLHHQSHRLRVFIISLIDSRSSSSVSLTPDLHHQSHRLRIFVISLIDSGSSSSVSSAPDLHHQSHRLRIFIISLIDSRS